MCSTTTATWWRLSTRARRCAPGKSACSRSIPRPIQESSPSAPELRGVTGLLRQAGHTVEGEQPLVKVRATVAEEAETRPEAARPGEVEIGKDESLLLRIRFDQHFALWVAYERGAVEGGVPLRAHPVRRAHVNAVRHRMPHHHPLPHVARVQLAGLNGLGADRGGVEEQIGALQGHDARRLREP